MTARPKPTLDEWAEHWSSKAEIENPIELNGYCIAGVPIDADLHRRAVIEPYVDLLELEPQHHVLEVGFGAGLLLKELEERADRVVGTDISDALVRRYEGSAETYVCAAHELPFAGEQFDRIAMCSVVRYFPTVEYLDEVIRKLVGLLRAPGVLLVGDVLIGTPPPDTPFRWFTAHEIVDVLAPLGLPYSIAAQNRLKRTINRRYDVIVYKD